MNHTCTRSCHASGSCPRRQNVPLGWVMTVALYVAVAASLVLVNLEVLQ